MHGIGNSYILLEDLNNDLRLLYPKLAVVLSNPSYGIGSDGLLVVTRGKLAPLQMRVFNPDGGEAEMCGNGIRMFARYVKDRGLCTGDELRVEVGGKEGGRVVIPRLTFRNGTFHSVRVNMGKGRVIDRVKEVDVGVVFTGSHVSVGNPHFVIFGPSSEELARKYGPLIENHALFQPERTNVEFVEPKTPNDVVVHVWERGAGYTLACGTGACAVAFVAQRVQTGFERDMTVHLPGGDLDVSMSSDYTIFLEGPAEYIFEGSVDIDHILSSDSSTKLFESYGV